MKLTGSTASGISKGHVRSGVSSGVVPSVKPTAPSALSSGSVGPIVSSGVVPSVKPTDPSAVSRSVKPTVNSDIPSGDVSSVISKNTNEASSGSGKAIVGAGASSGVRIGARSKPYVPVGDKGKSVASGEVGNVISLKDVSFGPHEGEVRFRLIHFWEAWNIQTKVLIGIEMLLIDEEANVIQGFIPQGKMETYMCHMKAGAVYRLNKFFGARSKPNFRVADSDVVLSFTWNSVLSVLDDSSNIFPVDRFRIHGYEEFDAACDMRGSLYDYIGHIKLVNGQVPNGSFLLDETEIASSRRVDLHVQTHDEPVLKICLWDNAAFEFCAKFKACGGTSRVILVTTLNPKRYGVLSLSSMTSSRVFVDSDLQETNDYLTWLDSNLDVANRVNAEAVIKPEPATLEELFSYMSQSSAKVAWFECTATIDDVVHGTGWYYIGCAVCHTKATKGPTTLMCKKCGKSEIVGVATYLSKLTVYDKSVQAVFVVLGDAGEELTGKKASELVESYYQDNDGVGVDAIVPVPQAMRDTIGQTRRFIVKVSRHNLDGKTRSLTVTKVLPLQDLEPSADMGVNSGEGPGDGEEDPAGDAVKRGAGELESDGVKRTKCG